MKELIAENIAFLCEHWLICRIAEGQYQQAPLKMEITNVTEYEAIAKQKLPKMVFDYYASGAEDQWTLQENRNAFSRIL